MMALLPTSITRPFAGLLLLVLIAAASSTRLPSASSKAARDKEEPLHRGGTHSSPPGASISRRLLRAVVSRKNKDREDRRRRLVVGTGSFKSTVISDLPDFSYAGYGGDALILPPPADVTGPDVVSVTDHGANPSDGADDSSGIEAAVAEAKSRAAAAPSNAAAVVVYFPAGLYRIENDLTFDLTGDDAVTFKGEVNSVTGELASTLFFPENSENDTPWVQYRGKTFVTIKGNGVTGPSGGPADVLVGGGASMNDFSLTVEGRPTWASAGALVRVIRKIGGVARQDAVLDYRGRGTSPSLWSKFGDEGRGTREFHTIRSAEAVSGNNMKLTFREPFKTDVVPDAGSAVSWTVEPWKGVARNVGVEDLVFRGNFRRDSSSNCRFHSSSSQSAGSFDADDGTWVNGPNDADLWCDGGPAGGKRCDGEFVHHCNYIHDTGYPALKMFRVADSYVRNCVFKDVTNALSLSSAYATTVLDVTVTASDPLGEIEPQMHTSVRVENGNDVFFGRVSMEVSSDHGLGLAGVASGVVFWKCSWPSVTGPEFHGKGLATQNLYDDCSGGMSSVNKGSTMSALGIGGSKGDLPHHGDGLWFWNLEVRLPSGQGDQAFTNDFGSDRGDHFWADDLSSYGPFVHGANFVARHPADTGSASSSGLSFVEGGRLNRGQIGIDEAPGEALIGLESSLYEAQRRLRDAPAGAGGWVLHPGKKCSVSRTYDETGGWGETNTLAKATAKCSSDPSCSAVYDYRCDGNGFVLCGRDRGDGVEGTGDAGFLVLEPAPSGNGGCTYSDPGEARFVLSKRDDSKCKMNRSYGTPGGLDYSSLDTPEKAFSECRSDPKCGGVYDYKCDGRGFMLCDVDGSDGRSALEAPPAEAGGCTYLHPERKYTEHGGKRCGSPRPYGTVGGRDYQTLRYLERALAECEEDPTCGGVYDYKCDEDGYKLCDRDGDVVDGVAESSLVDAPGAGGCTYRREY